MSERTQLDPSRESATALGTPVLQRACACGQHTVAGGACEGCRRREPLQAKLTVSQPGDVHEQEADRVADAVMRTPERTGAPNRPLLAVGYRSAVGRPVQRQADAETDQEDDEERRREEDEEELQAQPVSGEQPVVTAGQEARLDAMRGAGEPMATAVRTFFESRLGQDLADVRIHSGPDAGQLAETMHARAFTRGQDIFFAPGYYQPDTPAGRRLLAHELAHTLQQRQGGVASVADTIPRRAAPDVINLPAAPMQISPVSSLTSGSPATGEPDVTAAETPAAIAEGPSIPDAPPTAGATVTPLPAPPAGDRDEPDAPLAAGPSTPAAPLPAAPPQPAEDGALVGPEAVTLDASDETGLLQSLATVPVSSFGPAMTQAERSAVELQEQARADLAERLPVIDAPTGLPRRSERPAPESTMIEAGSVPEPAPAGSREHAPPETRHQEARGPLPATQVDTRVEEPADEGEDGGWWDWLTGALRRFLRDLPATDRTLDTRAGERLTVDTTGEADPSLNDEQQRGADKEVADRRADADAATTADFGEQDVYPDRPPGMMRPRLSPSGPPAGAGAGVREPRAVPAEVRAGLDQAGAGWLRGEVDQRVQQERQDRSALERDSAQAHADSQRQIEEETTRARAEQEDAQAAARGDVGDQRERWREENRRIRETYGRQAADQREKVDGQINAQVRSTEQRVEEELSGAERQAEEKRRETERKAQAKKREAENRPPSFWGRIRGAVSDFFDELKEAVNALFDELRRFVRDVIERAKRLAREWIEAARRAIVGLIRGFGEFLKTIATVALAAFPGAAERARRWIDARVEDAAEVVNRAADLLQAAVQRVLDAIGAALDLILSVYQRAYLLLIEGLRLLAVGLVEIMERIGQLVHAARQMPDHFLGQASEELLGQDLTRPLPFELTEEPTQAANVAAAVTTGQLTPEDARALTRTAVGDADVTVDRVAPLDLEPDFVAALALRDGEERQFGDIADPSRAVAAIQQEQTEVAPGGAIPAESATLDQPEEQPTSATVPAEPEPAVGAAPSEAAAPLSTEERLQTLMDQPVEACPKEASSDKADQSTFPHGMKFGPLTPGQRARYLLNQMLKGIKNWFSCNWPWLLAGAIGVLAVGIVATILTGGAILTAIPPLMQLIGMIMVGVALARVALYVREYLSLGWAGEIGAAARSLARGLAVGAIELVFALLFDLGAIVKAARQGLTATLRGAAATARQAGAQLLRSGRQIGRAARRTVRAPGRAAALVGRVAIRRGRMVFQGLRAGFARGVRSLDDLARRLWNTVRFRRFKLVRRGLRIQLYGYINPWVLLADGAIVEVFENELPAGAKLGDEVVIPGARAVDSPRPGVIVGEIPHRAEDLRMIAETASSKVLTEGPTFWSHFDDHRRLFRTAFGETFAKTPEGAKQFIDRLNELVHSGVLKPVGLATLKKGQPLSYIFRGKGLTLVMKPSGEWVTLLRSGEGLDLAIESFFQLRL